MNQAWNNVEVLIPRHVRQRQREAVEAACMDASALIQALSPSPLAPPDPGAANPLADADPDQCRDWVTRAIRAIPTQADMEAHDGNV